MVESPTLLYADMKIWREITGDADACVLQAELNIVISRSKERLIPINSAVYLHAHWGYKGK